MSGRRVAKGRFFLTAWLVLLSGCGGPTHYPVSGKVTLNGHPLPDAILSFMPASDEQSPLFARTDAEGAYVLDEADGVAGALVGEYTVRITTFRDGNRNIDPPIPFVPEKVPAKYNIQSKLTVDVKPEENVFNFDIVSKKRRRSGQGPF